MYQGRMGGFGLGNGGVCICTRCGYRTHHMRSYPCFQILCPHCGIPMTRYPIVMY